MNAGWQGSACPVQSSSARNCAKQQSPGHPDLTQTAYQNFPFHHLHPLRGNLISAIVYVVGCISSAVRDLPRLPCLPHLQCYSGGQRLDSVAPALLIWDLSISKWRISSLLQIFVHAGFQEERISLESAGLVLPVWWWELNQYTFHQAFRGFWKSRNKRGIKLVLRICGTLRVGHNLCTGAVQVL